MNSINQSGFRKCDVAIDFGDPTAVLNFCNMVSVSFHVVYCVIPTLFV